MEISLSQPHEPEKEIVPYDQTESAISRIRSLLDRVRAESPVTYLGAPLIRELSKELNGRRRKDKRPITACRLALAMRTIVQASHYWQTGSIVPAINGLELFEDEKPVSRTTRGLADVKAAKAARRKLAAASAAVDKIEAILTCPEVAIFVPVNFDVLVLLRMELETLQELTKVPVGLQRGHPVLSSIVSGLHEKYFDLTGSWLRERGDPTSPDRFISDSLIKVMRLLTPVDISDEVLGQTIETALKKKKNKRVP